MKHCKIFLGLVYVFMLAGCGATGPIKAYDQNTPVDKELLSIIYLPPEIELLEVNGIKRESAFIEEGFNEIHIPAGRHQVAIKYLAYWGDGASGSIVSSKPIVLRLDIAPKSSYYLKFKQPKDQWQAVNYAKDFSPWIEDASGKKLKIAKRLSGGSMLTSTSLTAGANDAPTGAGPLENLKYWWKQAGFKEKKHFEKWMNEN